ncbi:MAG: ribosome biogenesis GTPase Der [Planctomycetaceae bacterium]|jgi:GTP-binding protein|nr:ribosome biogenesis GTPase Der [Planctomycetaceae bacterium]MDP7277442.1 ribosome biogenesis GTPase Der [Planctomycetaceae bacterium]
MPVPRVAIIGRPNVGKSSLLNWLARRRISVVDPTAGVTRDRVTHLMQAGPRYFELVDTGGIGINDTDRLEEEIEHQIQVGLESADLLMFVVDGQQGITPLDREVAQRLHPLQKPILLVVNKCDSPRTEYEAPAFLELVDAPLVTTSVIGNRNRGELLASLIEILPPADPDEVESGEDLTTEPELKLALVGRRNVGKSTFINALADDERVITSEVPGTTRDSIDVRFEMDKKAFVAIDTPGVRKRKSIANDIEFYGLVRSRQSIQQADVVLMFFDSLETISRVDKQLVESVVENYTPCIFVVNKWDLAVEAGMTTERWSQYLVESFGMLRHAPIAFVTALTGRNAKKLINLSQSIFKQSRQRVSTGQLNRIVRAAIKKNAPPFRRNKRPKIYFATQVDTCPPTIVLKCNLPQLFNETWKRYLLGVFREELPFKEVPIRILLRPRQRDEGTGRALHEWSETDMIEAD